MSFRVFLRQVVIPLRDKLRNDAAPYLEPAEQVQASFLAARPTAWQGRQDCAVVVTDRRILLLDLDFFANPLGLYFLTHVTGVAGEAPRKTKLGPWSGELHYIRAFGTVLAVGSSFYMDVKEADLALGFEWPPTMYGLDDLHIERNLPGTEFDR